MHTTALRRFARWLLGRFSPPTPEIEEWEWYARDFARAKRGAVDHLGDEWDRPEQIGIDAKAEEIVERLDELVFRPFVGAPRSLLEIGAGGGRFTRLFAGRVERVIAADTAPTMLRLLRERFRETPGIEFLLLNGVDLQPLTSASVDVVFSYDVFVHLPPWEIFNYLLEIHRVLVPGGKAIIHHSSTLSELGWRKFEWDAKRVRERLRPAGRFTLMTPDLMVELARRSGLATVDLVTHVARRDCIALLEKPRQ